MFSKTRMSIDKLRVRAAHLGGIASLKATELYGKAKTTEVYEKTSSFTQAKIKAHRTIASVAAAGMLTAGLVGGTALVDASTDADSPAAAVADASARAGAADRADRANRGEAAPAAPPAEAPAAPAPAAPAPAPAPKPAAKKAAAWVSPIPGAELSSCFGARWGTEHKGIDFAAPAGTKIHAVGAGKVLAAGWLYTGYGISVVIDHGNGYLSHYAHASKAMVSEGQRVKAGQAIALEGSTGDSTGPHLHFEIHKGMWNQIEPAKWLRGKGVDIGC